MIMNKTKWIIFIIILFAMTSCFGLFDSGTKTIKGKFKLVWIDLQENQGIVESYDNSGSGPQIVSYLAQVSQLVLLFGSYLVQVSQLVPIIQISFKLINRIN